MVTNNARSENGVRHVRRRIKFVIESDGFAGRLFSQIHFERRAPHREFFQVLYFRKPAVEAWSLLLVGRRAERV